MDIYRGLSRYKRVLDNKAKNRFLLAKKSGLLGKKLSRPGRFWKNANSVKGNAV